MAVVLIGALVAALVAGLVTWTARSGSSKAWDARVAPIASEVQRLRGLDYKHAVPVDFLTDQEFRKRVRVDRVKLSKDDERDLARAQGELRALGLIQGDLDLLAAANKLGGEGILAYYDPHTKRITVRGKQLDLASRVTVAHELTHVLQDQHFDLEHLRKQARAAHSTVPVTALIEGDAVRTQTRYVAGLSKAQQDEYARTQQSQVGSFDQATKKDVPEILIALQAAPYTLGQAMVEVIAAQGGEGAVDDAFRSPPKTERDFLDPLAYVSGERAKKVTTPRLEAGEQREGTPDRFGAFGLYLTLASRLDPHAALTVADVWGGDAQITFKKGSTFCLRATFVGKTASDTSTIADALRTWAARGPAGAATVSVGADTVGFTACDPGPTTPRPSSANDAMTLVVGRDSLVAGLVKEGLQGPSARCVADRVVANAALFEKLVSLQGAADLDPATADALRATASACGAGR